MSVVKIPATKIPVMKYSTVEIPMVEIPALKRNTVKNSTVKSTTVKFPSAVEKMSSHTNSEFFLTNINDISFFLFKIKVLYSNV